MKSISSLMCAVYLLSIGTLSHAQTSRVGLQAQEAAARVYLATIDRRTNDLRENRRIVLEASRLLGTATFEHNKAKIWAKPAEIGGTAAALTFAAAYILIEINTALPKLKTLQILRNLNESAKLAKRVSLLAGAVMAGTAGYAYNTLETTRAKVEEQQRNLEFAKNILEETRKEYAEEIKRIFLPLGARITEDVNVISFEGLPAGLRNLAPGRMNLNTLEIDNGSR